MEWKTKLPNIPEDTYGPAFEPTIIAAINELRAPSAARRTGGHHR